MKISFHKMAIAAAVAAAAPITALAQDTVFEEIVVTATKRAQTLQDIPIAVSVTSSETIEQAQIQDIADLQSVVPTLRVSQTQSSINTTFVIRGFGNGGNNPGIEPSVGVFVDGVYRSRAASSISDFPNLERIEVLSGPQSTLFGKNASAGVISIVTQKPTGESAGQVSASLGNYGSLILKGYYEGAFSDNAAFSIAATHNENDGYFRNIITGNDINNRDRQAIRGQLVLNPNDTTEIRVIADYDTVDEECCGVTNVVSGPATAAINFAGGQILPNQPFALEGFGNVDPTNEIENTGLSVQVDKDFDAFTLTSITAFRNTESFYNIDADFSGAPIIQNALTDEFNTFTQEFRLTSNAGDKLDWMVGGFYFDESVDHEDDLPFGPGFRPFVDFLGGGLVTATESIIGAPVGRTFFQAGQGFTHEATLDNEAVSVFGQLDFNISDSLTATVGLNYTKDEKEATLTQTRRNPFSDLNLARIGASFFTSQTGLPLTPQTLAAVAQSGPRGAQLAAVAGGLASDAARGLQFTPAFSDLPNSIEDNKTDDDELTYTLRLAYDINDSVNVYGGYSTGFKASSWNLSRDSRPTSAQLAAVQASPFAQPNQIPGTRFAGPEEATVIEIGLKSTFERGAFNIAVFDQSIEGFQSNAFTGTGFNLTNAGEQSVKGVEFDLTYYPTDSLELKLAGTLLDPVYDSFEGAGRNSLTNEVFSLTGQEVGGITKTNLSAAANYRFRLGSNDAFLRADYFFEDETPIGDSIPQNPVINTGVFTRDSKNLNIAAGVVTDGGLGVTVWVRNATDHETLTSAFPGVAQDLNFGGYRNLPRTYGVTLTKDF